MHSVRETGIGKARFHWAHPFFAGEPSLGVMAQAALWGDATEWSNAQWATTLVHEKRMFQSWPWREIILLGGDGGTFAVIQAEEKAM